MFAKYVGRFRESDDGSLSVSKSALENQVSQPSRLVDFAKVEDVDICQHPGCEVDVQDSIHAQNGREVVNVVPIIQKTSEKAQKREKDEVQVPFAVERKEKDQIADAPAAAKLNVSPVAATPTAAPVPTMPNKPQQKQPPKAAAVVKQSDLVQLSPRRPKPAPEKTADPKTGNKEVKGGSSATEAKTVGGATAAGDPKLWVTKTCCHKSTYLHKNEL
jgi:hypothetical protein